MRNTIFLVASALMVLVGPPARARSIPAMQSRVTDEAMLLPPAERSRLEARLLDYEQKTGHQFAVVIVQSLQGEALEAWSLRVAEQWRLGDKTRDDGLLLVVAVQDRAVRVEVGYGLEGAVPDVLAARVIRDVIVPRFAAQDFAGGISDGLDVLMKAAAGEATGLPAVQVDRRLPGFVGFGLMLFFVLLQQPRPVRAVLFALVGAVGGAVALSSTLWAVLLAVLGVVLGLVLPRVRGRRRHPNSGWVSGGFSSGGFGGGFSGGGGGFGGGGASGRW